MKILRTPDECFDNLEDYPFEPNYIDLEHDDQTLRMHFLDENPESEEIVLLCMVSLHGHTYIEKLSLSWFPMAKELLLLI